MSERAVRPAVRGDAARIAQMIVETLLI